MNTRVIQKVVSLIQILDLSRTSNLHIGLTCTEIKKFGLIFLVL